MSPPSSNSLRSLLFVPADQPQKIEKSWRSGADCIVLDLEDSVSAQQKDVARQILASKLASLTAGFPPVMVRINSRPVEWTEDLEASIRPGLYGLLIPKCASAAELVELDHAAECAEIGRGIDGRPIRLFLLVETARGLLNLPSLVMASNRTAGLVFGPEDLCLDMDMPRNASELSFARWQIALCARANGLAAIDGAFCDFRDLEGLWQETRKAKTMGFTGKLAIHPLQIESIHSAFVPDEAEVANARVTLAAFERAQQCGEGAVALGGKMVDAPVAERARRILQRARRQGGD